MEVHHYTPMGKARESTEFESTHTHLFGNDNEGGKQA